MPRATKERARIPKEVDMPVGLEGETEGNNEGEGVVFSGFSLSWGKGKHVPDVHHENVHPVRRSNNARSL